jgi:hypothetical protein
MIVNVVQFFNYYLLNIFFLNTILKSNKFILKLKKSIIIKDKNK